MDNIQKFPVPGEFQMPGRGFLLTADYVRQLQSPLLMVQPVHFHMIHAQIRCAQIFIIPCHFHAVHMGPEISLRNAPQPFMKNLVRNLSHAAVFFQTQRGNFTVMIPCHEQKLILIVRGKITAPHAVDGTEIYHLQIPVLQYPVRFHPKVRNGIQAFHAV